MTRRALLVANDSYHDSSLNGLISPETDAVELGELLKDRRVGGFEVEILVNESKLTVEQAIERLFAEARPDDVVLLYFSGHGVRDRRRRLHFAVPRTDVLSGLASTSVSASFVKERMADSDAEAVVVLLDCCYSGLFTEDGLKSGPQPDMEQELQDFASGRGVFVLTATDAVQEAADGVLDAEGAPGQSAFTAAVVHGLRSGDADVRGVGSVTPDDLWQYVSTEVPGRTDGRQTPTQFGRLESPIELARVGSGGPKLFLETGSRLSLGRLTGELTATPLHGFRATAWEGSGRLIVPIGQVVAHGERSETMSVSFGQRGGHILTVGKMGAGKSSLLRTLACSLAMTHSPSEIALEFLESGANKLGSLQALPHVRSVVGDDESDAVTALLDRTEELIKQRKALFRKHGLVSTEHFRNSRGTLPEGPHPDLVIFIDQWSDFAGAIPKFAARIERLINVGREFGVHLAVATRRPLDLPRPLFELFGSYIELRLPDPDDSLIDPALSRRLPESEPGWALMKGLRFRVAQPFLSDDSPLEEPYIDGAAEIIDRIDRAWTPAGPAAPAGRWPTATFAEPAGPEETSPDTKGIRLAEVLGFEATEFRPGTHWKAKPADDYLRVPIGIGAFGREPLALDLKEASQGGMGPHGLLVGATGSGKSEVLRTIVGSLIATHSPDELNLVLVDFKGGATFAALDELPHVSAVITNLADEMELVDRMADALEGELVRRQEALRAAGNFANRWVYEQARLTGQRLEPMPSLLVVVDEFSEMLVAKPEFINQFLYIGRIGRSLGVHMLLATQRLGDGKLRGLEGFLSYRLALRTFTQQESRAAIGSNAASELPPAPGHGYLQVGTQELVRFRAAYSGTAVPATEPGSGEPVRSEIETLVELSKGRGRPARQVWLPPLAEPPSLDLLLPRLTADPARGLSPGGGESWKWRLRAVLGEEDRPFEQRRAPLVADLGGAQGNVAVAGAAQTGKSTLLRSMIGSLALTHTPREVQFYCLDFGGGTLRALAGLPHVAGVFGRQDDEGVRRTLQELTAILDDRETHFTANGIDSMASYRRLKAQGRFADDPFGDLFLVVDNWMTLREDFEPFVDQVRAIGNRGLAFGVHVVVTCTRWGDIRMNMRDMFGLKIELKLSDSMESEIDRKAAANVPPNRPGRGLSPNKLHFLAAVPRIDSIRDGDDLQAGVEDLVSRVREAWPGRPCPPVRLLPKRLPVADFLKAVDRTRPGIPIGLDEAGLKPVHLDFDKDPHLLVFGDSGSGKTNLLRHLAREIRDARGERDAKIIMVDYRRGMLEEIGEPTLLDYAMSSSQLLGTVKNLKGPMEKRLPSHGVTAVQLRDRSWWTGPDLYLLVDDYDIVATRLNPLADLSDLIAHGRDIGFHIVVARRTSGAARSTFDPVVSRVSELESPLLVMSGSRGQGALFNKVRPSPQPPGRGILLRRIEGEQVVQTALLPPNGFAEKSPVPEESGGS
jgi:S-DNA-T family DNA segregation ATPase FtsK/SpoIIIE